MKTTPAALLFLLLTITVACTKKENKQRVDQNIYTIAFGSCAYQHDPQPVLEKVTEKKPDLFIYLGDNIYSDTYSMDTLKMNYAILGARPEFQKLKASVPILATWDDHDFGMNDSGRHYQFKEESKNIFLDFFGVPDSSLLQHPGIYYSKIIKQNDRNLQIIMLDMRTFRDKLIPYTGNQNHDVRFNYELDYSPYTTGDSTMLGEAQWQWLEAEFQKPADIRIVGSSTQFGITHNGYEAWANFPHEQKKMLDLIKRTKANGVIFISGDVHYAEISKLTEDGLYAIYDVTSSGITSTWNFATPNDHRVDGPVMENNFGLIKIDWSKTDPEILLQICDVKGNKRINRTIQLSDLQVPQQ
jgi:alkaline phosphatase D